MIPDFVNGLLTDVKPHLKPGRFLSGRVLGAHQHIIDAIVNKDGEAAVRARYDHLCQVEQELEKGKQAVAATEQAAAPAPTPAPEAGSSQGVSGPHTGQACASLPSTVRNDATPRQGAFGLFHGAKEKGSQ